MTMGEHMPDIDDADDKPMGPEWKVKLSKWTQKVLSSVGLWHHAKGMEYDPCRAIPDSIRTFSSRGGNHVLTTSRWSTLGGRFNSRGVVHGTDGKVVASVFRDQPLFWHEFFISPDGQEFLFYGPSREWYSCVRLSDGVDIAYQTKDFEPKEAWQSRSGRLMAMAGMADQRMSSFSSIRRPKDEIRIYEFHPGAKDQAHRIGMKMLLADSLFTGHACGWSVEDGREVFRYMRDDLSGGTEEAKWVGGGPTSE